jgi:hypothetical protein
MEDIVRFIDIVAWMFLAPLWMLFVFHYGLHYSYLKGPKYKLIEEMQSRGAPVKHPRFHWPRWGKYAVICTAWIVARMW